MSVTNRDLGSPDETKTFDHGRVDVVRIGAITFNRSTLEPGWRWSQDIKPIARTESCQVHHVGFLLSGRLGVSTQDGGEAEIRPGEVYEIQPGHEGWVVGGEPVVSIELLGTVS